jgi:hypothetical protein
MKSKTYVFHSDAGHGWLAVKRQELVKLGIIDKVSSCSYQKGNTVYLEEDCDCSLFINALEVKGIKFEHREGASVDRSPIRSYESFRN